MTTPYPGDKPLENPLGLHRAVSKPLPSKKSWVVSKDLGSSPTLQLAGCVTLGQSLHLSRPQFPHPHDGEVNVSLTGMLRGSTLITRVALYLTVSIKFVVRGPRRT